MERPIWLCRSIADRPPQRNGPPECRAAPVPSLKTASASTEAEGTALQIPLPKGIQIAPSHLAMLRAGLPPAVSNPPAVQAWAGSIVEYREGENAKVRHINPTAQGGPDVVIPFCDAAHASRVSDIEAARHRAPGRDPAIEMVKARTPLFAPLLEGHCQLVPSPPRPTWPHCSRLPRPPS